MHFSPQHRGLPSSCAWPRGLLLPAYVGPEHASLFKSVHAWLLSMPVDEALSQAHAVFVSVVWELVKISLVLGIGQKLLIIVKPAIEQVKHDFEVAGRAA